MKSKRMISMVFTIFAGVLILTLSLPAEGKDSSTEDVVKGNTTFALDLYSKLKKEEDNLFFSPHSISTAIAMTYAGARGNTEKQMAKVFHFTLDQKELHPVFASIEAGLNAIQKKGNVQLSVANALWPQKDYVFLKDYLTLTKKYYGVSITPVDYKKAAEMARIAINEWVEQETNNKIKDLIAKGVLNASVRLVLTNAIYFKGYWASQFDEKRTKEAPFHLLSGESIQVPMMNHKEKYGYAEHEDFQILELPYVGDELSMLVLLPKKVDGLKELEEELTVDTLEKWTRNISNNEVQVFLPKFKMDSQFDLSEVLASLGMPDAFIMGKANFSGMDGTRNLFISAVIHKAFIAVDEQGTEAAAATAVSMVFASVDQAPPPIFRADHPFLFIIRDNLTGSILFIGRIVNPTA